MLHPIIIESVSVSSAFEETSGAVSSAPAVIAVAPALLPVASFGNDVDNRHPALRLSSTYC
jgi:hypothetical protein